MESLLKVLLCNNVIFLDQATVRSRSVGFIRNIPELMLLSVNHLSCVSHIDMGRHPAKILDSESFEVIAESASFTSI